jgi:ankyrin repeat protein
MRRKKEAETLELASESISGVRDKAIVYAVTKGQYAMARASFEVFKGDVNEFVRNNTLLDIVCDIGDGAMLKILVDAKADPNVKNAQGVSLISKVMERGETEMVLHLLECGAKIELEKLEGEKCADAEEPDTLVLGGVCDLDGVFLGFD